MRVFNFVIVHIGIAAKGTKKSGTANLVTKVSKATKAETQGSGSRVCRFSRYGSSVRRVDAGSLGPCDEV
jgi:hypothetical protein